LPTAIECDSQSPKFELLSSQPGCPYRFDDNSSFFPPPRVYARIDKNGMLFMMVFCTYNQPHCTSAIIQPS